MRPAFYSLSIHSLSDEARSRPRNIGKRVRDVTISTTAKSYQISCKFKVKPGSSGAPEIARASAIISTSAPGR